MFKINGKSLPTPSWGLNLQRQQFVDSARNALGQVVAQVINRRIDKFDNLHWAKLTASEWASIQREIDKFEGVLEYWDNPSQSFVTRRVYWGDESSEIYAVDSDGRPTVFVNCTCNLVDMGY